jgi:hypothetical protein
LKVVIGGDAAGLFAALSKSGKKLKEFGSTADGASKSTSRMSKATHAFKVAGLASIPVVGFLAYQLHSAVEEAAAYETSTTRLKDAVTHSHQSWKGLSEQVSEVVHQQSLLSAFSLPEVTDALAKQELATGNLTKATKLNALAEDIARGRNMSLTQASLLVAKAYQGNVTGLKRLGITLPDISNKMSKVEARQRIINYLTRKFGGDAEAYGKTGQGALDKLGNAFDDIKITIGTALLPVIKTLADKTAAWLGKASTTRKINHLLATAGEIIKTDVIPELAKLKTMFDETYTVVKALSRLIPGLYGNSGRPAGPEGRGFGSHGTGGLQTGTHTGGMSQGMHPGRARGGPVLAGQSYMINEEGPELLTLFPGGGGYVTPNRAGGRAGGGISVTQHFYGVSRDPRAMQAEAIWAMRRLLPHAIG